MSFYTRAEEQALKRHAHVRQLQVNDAARKLVDAAQALRASLGASPDSYEYWQEYLEKAEKDIACIKERAGK